MQTDSYLYDVWEDINPLLKEDIDNYIELSLGGVVQKGLDTGRLFGVGILENDQEALTTLVYEVLRGSLMERRDLCDGFDLARGIRPSAHKGQDIRTMLSTAGPTYRSSEYRPGGSAHYVKYPGLIRPATGNVYISHVLVMPNEFFFPKCRYLVDICRHICVAHSENSHANLLLHALLTSALYRVFHSTTMAARWLAAALAGTMASILEAYDVISYERGEAVVRMSQSAEPRFLSSHGRVEYVGTMYLEGLVKLKPISYALMYGGETRQESASRGMKHLGIAVPEERLQYK